MPPRGAGNAIVRAPCTLSGVRARAAVATACRTIKKLPLRTADTRCRCAPIAVYLASRTYDAHGCAFRCKLADPTGLALGRVGGRRKCSHCARLAPPVVVACPRRTWPGTTRRLWLGSDGSHFGEPRHQCGARQTTLVVVPSDAADVGAGRLGRRRRLPQHRNIFRTKPRGGAWITLREVVGAGPR
jgi:hypothetical protein